MLVVEIIFAVTSMVVKTVLTNYTFEDFCGTFIEINKLYVAPATFIDI